MKDTPPLAIAIVCGVLGLTAGLLISSLLDNSNETVAEYRETFHKSRAEIERLKDTTSKQDADVKRLTAEASGNAQLARANELQAEVDRLTAELATANESLAASDRASETIQSQKSDLARQLDALRPHGRDEPGFDFGKVVVKDNGDIVGHVTNRRRSSYSSASFRLSFYDADDGILDVVVIPVGKLPPNVAVPFKATTTVRKGAIHHFNMTVDSAE